MGNRAHIVFADKGEQSISPAIYLHWNGGPESVYAFLAELDRRDVRGDQDYEAARFIAIVAQHFDQDYYTGVSLGVHNGPRAITVRALDYLDHGDNGVYVIYRGSETTQVRRFVSGENGLRELTPIEVAREKRAAMNHRYNTGEDTIASTYAGKLTEEQHRAA